MSIEAHIIIRVTNGAMATAIITIDVILAIIFVVVAAIIDVW